MNFLSFTKSVFLFIISFFYFAHFVSAQGANIKKLLYGVAYYDEYMPYRRLGQDIKMMKEAGINVVRIAESTWSTVEPRDGFYDFSHIDKEPNAMHQAGISVIIGTPTYAFPTWQEYILMYLQ